MINKKQLDEYGLTLKERTFADEFLFTNNKAASARKAGIKASNAAVYSSRILKNVMVQKYLAIRRDQLAIYLQNNYQITQDELLRELAAIVFFDPAKMYDEDGTLLTIPKMDEMTRRAIASFDVRDLTDRDGAWIGTIMKVKLSSKIAAIELLGRHLGMWENKNKDESSILNINIVTHENQLDNPNYGKNIK